MNWNADADAKVSLTHATSYPGPDIAHKKLLIGIILQLRSANVKLNTQQLADFMGPGMCLVSLSSPLIGETF